MDADPSINEAAPSIDEVMCKLRGGKAASICNISAELLKAGGEAMIRGLHAILTAIWHSGTIPPDWKRGSSLSGKAKGTVRTAQLYREIMLLSVSGKVFTHLLLMRVRSHLLKYQRPEQSGFTLGRSTTDCILALGVLVES